MSKTQEALQWLKNNAGDKKASGKAAAKKFGLAPSTVNKALKIARATADKRCPTCGQIIRKP